MSVRHYGDYVRDILQSIDEADDFTRGLSFEAFSQDRRTVNAVIRSLEVLGEAANKIPKPLQRRFSEIPWKWIIRMRNKLIHEYFGVDLEIVWEVIKTDLPPIRPYVVRMLAELETD